MLAAKEEQLRAFQEEMATLKESLLADEKETCCLPPRSAPKDPCRLRRENDQIMTNMEQWAKDQKIANEQLGNKLREQVKYIAKLTGEKEYVLLLYTRMLKNIVNGHVIYTSASWGQFIWLQ
ncbi:polyamine modulated factor 1 binding protein 1 [Phyllostomus discolor]|uniref:Polyamine modulated factor 1 binding protein 1 n=1 Tax=Phyllostomus discolor TaxID=89673 RepID=A0A834DI60_9CHIR|nr:polyamine modulated factor 1 binding protein 1 [Phyllostomus discolor]